MQELLSYKAEYFRILIDDQYFKSYTGTGYHPVFNFATNPSTPTKRCLNLTPNKKQAHRIKWFWCFLSELELLSRAVTDLNLADVQVSISWVSGQFRTVNLSEIIDIDAFKALCKELQQRFLDEEINDPQYDPRYTPKFSLVKRAILCTTAGKEFYNRYNQLILFKSEHYKNTSVNQEIYDTAKNLGIDCKKVKELSHESYQPKLLLKNAEDLNLLKITCLKPVEKTIDLSYFRDFIEEVKIQSKN